MSLPELGGVLSIRDVRDSARAIARAQEPTGAIPWYPGGHTDPWDHVESAMALDVGGLHREASAAYDWLAASQRPDGSWAAAYRWGRVEDPKADANFTAYVAVGVWHHYLSTSDRRFLFRLWPTVRAAIGFVLGLQAPGGEVRWARDTAGDPSSEALLTGNASMYQSLRCALAVAAEIGDSQPDWELAVGRLGHAVASHPERFSPRERYSMDWYYPVLGGAVRGHAALERLDEDWERFVVPGLGIRCVADQPWVTGAETCELALALEAVGRTEDAAELVAAMQHLRDPDGSYWTGYVFTDGKRWPVEQSTWTAAAVLLAVDALARATPGSGVFRGTGLPAGVRPSAVVCEDEAACLQPSGRRPGDAAQHA